VETVEEMVGAEFGLDAKELHAHGHRSGLAKTVAIELCCRYSGKSQRDLMRHFGYSSDSGIARQRRVLREKLRSSAALRRRLAGMERSLSRSKV
jgi:hypothetical protein